MLSSVLGDQEVIDGWDSDSALPQQKLMELRFRGMQAIRFEFIVRLMQLKIEIYTLSIYWEDRRNSMHLPTVQKSPCKLVFASAVRVSGEFEDISLLRYAHDREVTAKVDAELDRMVTVIDDFFAGVGVGVA